ncbi:MAG: hypothetical protein OXG81_14395 [Acidobacteria bacterium]|nr:hypothetical protein [Acidobacteriota bacterium]
MCARLRAERRIYRSGSRRPPGAGHTRLVRSRGGGPSERSPSLSGVEGGARCVPFAPVGFGR